MDNHTASYYHHPLSRDGMSRLDSENPALSPHSVQLDGRDLSSILQYLYEFARQINHYEQNSRQRAGDWTPFFRESVPFQYALIGSFDLQRPEQRLADIESAIDSSLDNGSLHLLFDLIFDMADQLEQWLSALRMDNSGLRAAIENLIDTNLREQYLQLIHLANAAGQHGYRRTKNAETLERFWKINPMQVFAVDTSLLRLRGNRRVKIQMAKAALKERFRIFWKGLEAVVLSARDKHRLEQSIMGENGGSITPHIGLLFAFIKLFQGVQKEGLNALTEQHLRFFYRNILGLKEQEAVADRAYLTFTLAKQSPPSVRLDAGTAFLAGKGSDGRDILFRLEEELILTRASVASLKTLFLDPGGTTTPVKGLYAAPAANTADGRGEEDFARDQVPLWPTVGAARSNWFDPESQSFAPMPPAQLGFVLASNVLFLQEGKRTVIVKLTMNEDAGILNGKKFLRPELSTGEGWAPVPADNVSVVAAGNIITLQFTLAEDFLPVLYPGAEVLEHDYGHRSPILRLWLDHSYASLYGNIRSFKVCGAEIEVRVCGLRRLVVQNDQAVLDVNKPFMPFGPMPKAVNSNFYIGSEEVFRKNWTKIGLNIAWKDVPQPNFREYYEAYENRPNSNDDFTASVAVLSEKTWLPKSGAAIRLFNDNAPGTSDCPAVAGSFRSVMQRSEFGNPAPCTPAGIENGYTVSSQCGFLRLRLGARDFYHDKYANLLAAKMLQIANISGNASTVAALASTNKFHFLNISDFQPAINAADTARLHANTTKNATADAKVNADGFDLNPIGIGNRLASLQQRVTVAYNAATASKNAADLVPDRIQNITAGGQVVLLPNPPYTPHIESLSIDYTASASVADGSAAFAHLYPYEEEGNYLAFENMEECPTLLPCFTDEGALFIGLDELQAGDNLSLLFRLEPSTADPRENKAPVCWEYLRDNTWLPLAKDIAVRHDGTDGLLQTGIVKIAVPTDISRKRTTILPAHLHWIKIRTPYRTAAISEALSVHAQAGAVRFDLESSDTGRLDQTLGVGAIAKFAGPAPGVKEVLQLQAGFGGKPAEPASEFYRRISNHLRHKGRAISLYDYENLVLEEFRHIYKVKCITHTLGRRSRNDELPDIERAPGHVTLVVIPDLAQLHAKNPLQPLLPASDLSAVQHYLQQRISPFIRLHVLNPKYQAVRVQARVRFRPGRSVSFYQKQLEQDVKIFLAPWAFAGQRADISFGGQIYYSTVVKFIEEREYVDYLSDLLLVDETDESAGPQEKIKARTSRSILTSAEHHHFEVITGEDLPGTTQYVQRQGIGAFIINR